jgi:hypothetical protein
MSRKYSNTNPPYLEEAAAHFIRESGIQHLLIDLPMWTKKRIEGKLWLTKLLECYRREGFKCGCKNKRNDNRVDFFVEEKILDGSYLLNLTIASFENDASPSKPVLYALV